MAARAAVGRPVIALVAVAVMVVSAVAYFSMTNPGGLTSVETTGSSTQTMQTSSTSASSSQSTIQSSCTVPAGGSGNITITRTAGQFPPCGCVLVDSNSNGSLYVSTNSKVGDNVCMTASLNHSAEVYLSVTSSAGRQVFSPGMCVASQLPGAPPPTGDTCTAYWDTTKPDLQGNPIEPGTYHLIASDSQGSQVVLEANLTLS